MPAVSSTAAIWGLGGIAVTLAMMSASRFAAVTDDPATTARAAAREAGISAPGCVVAGVTATDATAMATALSTKGDALVRIGNLKTQAETAAGEIVRLREEIRWRPSDRQLKDQLAAAEAQYDAAIDSIEAERSDLRRAAFAGLDAGEVAELERARGRSFNERPEVAALFAAELSAAESARASAALIAEKRARRLGTTLDSENASLLSTLRADQRVISTRLALENSLDGVRSALHGE